MPNVPPALLPVRPRPFEGELFSSWFIRLAHANAQRLPYFTRQMTGDDYFWRFDPDRFLRPGVAQSLADVTGLTAGILDALTLRRYEGRVVPRLHSQGSGRWIVPLCAQGYRRRRPGLAYCPACLREELFLRAHWRLSFVTTCQQHRLSLLDSCPHCRAPYAPHRNDLGSGADWSVRSEPPFGFCPECGLDLKETEGKEAGAEVLAFQAWLMRGVAAGVFPWPGQGDVPILEGLDVIHQLLAVLYASPLGDHLTDICKLPGPQRLPERRNRSFEDFGLHDRQLLLRQVGFLVEDWPERLIQTCEAAGVTKEPLMANFHATPPWYERVADRLSRANGRRPYKPLPLVQHLSLAELAASREQAPTAAERRRWDLLWRYAQQKEPAVLPFARALGVDRKFVHTTVTRYNALGPSGMDNARRGQSNPRKRLLTPDQERELHLALTQGAMTNAEMADWVESRTGRRPDRSTLWMYRRGVKNHGNKGRRADSHQGAEACAHYW